MATLATIAAVLGVWTAASCALAFALGRVIRCTCAEDEAREDWWKERDR